MLAGRERLDWFGQIVRPSGLRCFSPTDLPSVGCLKSAANLRQQAAAQLAEQQELGDEWIDSGRVFTAEDGLQLHPERISALFARLVVAAALPPIPLHGLRHTYASLALAKGVNAAIVSRRLGHSTVAFTLDIYSHVLPQVDAEAAELIAAFAGRDR